MSKPVSIRLGASAVGQNLAEYLAHAGYLVHADCGGKGKCGKCRVRLVQGHLYDNAACTRFATPDAVFAAVFVVDLPAVFFADALLLL